MSSDPYVFGFSYGQDTISGCDFDDVEEVPQTERSVIEPATLTIEDLYEPMFFTATWTPCAKINGKIVHISAYRNDKPHTPTFLKVWARKFIMRERDMLKENGVDVTRAYAEQGGDVRDI